MQKEFEMNNDREHRNLSLVIQLSVSFQICLIDVSLRNFNDYKLVLHWQEADNSFAISTFLNEIKSGRFPAISFEIIFVETVGDYNNE